MSTRQSQRAPAMATEFPAGKLALTSSHTSETFGAFDEMDLSKQQRVPEFAAPAYISRHSPQVPAPTYAVPTPPIHRPHHSDESSESMVRFNDTYHVNGVPRRTFDDEAAGMMPEAIYKPTTIPKSDAGSSVGGRRQYGKLVDVYSNSGDTVEFAHNFSTFMNANVSPFIWISLFAFLCLYGLFMMFVGIFNVPYCSVQPMIPIFMIILGLLSITASCLRIYFLWPAPRSLMHRRTQHRNLSGTLVTRVIELVLLIAIIVWLILGAVWVYGSRPFVHFNEGMFEHHFCDWGLYWIAFWSVTIHLVLIAVVIVAVIVLLAVGAYKEAEVDEVPPR